ncbi:hypothetical protein FRC03_001939 [Tulasnella sp. 419]|nr:hypothetical protein FRC03_001939 [Tulasnella sp. 419]
MTVAGLKGEEYGDECTVANIASSSEVELLITAPVLPKKTKFFPQTRSSSGSPGGRQQRSHQTKVPTDRAKSESPKVRNALAPKIHHRASSDRLRAPHSQKPRAPSPLSQQLSNLKLSPYSGKRIHVEGGSMTSAWAPKAADEHLPSSVGHMDTDIDMDHDGYGKESSTGSSETPPRHLAKNNRLFKSAVRDCTRPVE